MAGAHAVGSAGRGWGSSYAGSAGCHLCVRVGTRCSPPPRSVAVPLRGASEAGHSPPSGCPPPGGCQGPLPTCCGHGCAGTGSVVRGVRGQAFPLPGLSALWAGCWSVSTLAVGVGVGVWGPDAVPSACMPCGDRAPRGCWGPSPGGWPATVARGFWCQELSLPRPPALWAGHRGPQPTCCGRGHAVVGGPALSPRPACPPGAACPRGGGGPPPGGVACHRCEGRLVSDAVPPQAARLLGWLAGVLRPVCPGCGRCGRGDPAPAPQRAPWRAGVARRGGGGGASPGGCLPLLR